jgi:hypothetical protein
MSERERKLHGDEAECESGEDGKLKHIVISGSTEIRSLGCGRICSKLIFHIFHGES